tara:strand:+ start:1023 stop:2006 length:984 start_codon:yes stop_codon:yes gene_type:complete
MNASNLINLADQPGFAEMAVDFLMKTNERLTQELKTSVEEHDADRKILTSYRDVMGEIEALEEQDKFDSTIDELVDYIKDLKEDNKKLCQWVKTELEESTALKQRVSELNTDRKALTSYRDLMEDTGETDYETIDAMTIDYVKDLKQKVQYLSEYQDDHPAMRHKVVLDADYYQIHCSCDYGSLEEMSEKIVGLEEKLKLELKISRSQKWLLDQKETMATELKTKTAEVEEWKDKLLSANVEVANWENTLANYGDNPSEVNDSIGELECEKDTLEERKDELEAEVCDWENTLKQWGETPDEVFSSVMTELKIKVAGAIDLLEPKPTH